MNELNFDAIKDAIEEISMGNRNRNRFTKYKFDEQIKRLIYFQKLLNYLLYIIYIIKYLKILNYKMKKKY